MSEQLKPCPFCGGKAELKQKGGNGFVVKCTGCHIQLTQKVLRKPLEWLEVKMIGRWNERVQDTFDRTLELPPFDVFAHAGVVPVGIPYWDDKTMVWKVPVKSKEITPNPAENE